MGCPPVRALLTRRACRHRTRSTRASRASVHFAGRRSRLSKHRHAATATPVFGVNRRAKARKPQFPASAKELPPDNVSYNSRSSANANAEAIVAAGVMPRRHRPTHDSTCAEVQHHDADPSCYSSAFLAGGVVSAVCHAGTLTAIIYAESCASSKTENPTVVMPPRLVADTLPACIAATALTMARPRP